MTLYSLIYQKTEKLEFYKSFFFSSVKIVKIKIKSGS